MRTIGKVVSLTLAVTALLVLIVVLVYELPPLDANGNRTFSCYQYPSWCEKPDPRVWLFFFA